MSGLKVQGTLSTLYLDRRMHDATISIQFEFDVAPSMDALMSDMDLPRRQLEWMKTAVNEFQINTLQLAAHQQLPLHLHNLKTDEHFRGIAGGARSGHTKLVPPPPPSEIVFRHSVESEIWPFQGFFTSRNQGGASSLEKFLATPLKCLSAQARFWISAIPLRKRVSTSSSQIILGYLEFLIVRVHIIVTWLQVCLQINFACCSIYVCCSFAVLSWCCIVWNLYIILFCSEMTIVITFLL